MGLFSKGGSKGPSLDDQLEAQKKAIEMSRPDQIQLQTTGYGGMGFDMPSNPMKMGSAQAGMGLGAPAWATGDWAMPWWGQQAPNVGMAMLQQQGWGPYANGGQPQSQGYGAGAGAGPGAGPAVPPMAPQQMAGGMGGGKSIKWGGPADVRDYHLWEQMGKPDLLEWWRSPYGGSGAIDWGPNGGNG